MRKIAAMASAAALGLSAQAAFGYGGTAEVTLSWGGNAGGLADANSAYGATADTNADIAWTSNGTSVITAVTNSTQFSTLGGYNSRSYYNADFASAANCTVGGGVVPTGATSVSRRKYGCRFTTYFGTPSFAGTPVSDTAAALAGGAASGTLTVTDTTLTGVLTLSATTDEPTGATTAFSPSGVRLSNSAGNGFNGFNYRSADGSPFGNYWQGVTTAATLTVNLTGVFTETAWDITGGTVRLFDGGFACQQGGLGSTTDAQAGTLCTTSTAGGGQQPDGTHLSWGFDADAGGPGAIGAVIVKDAGGAATLASLSGVLASLAVDGAGNISTVSGEFRRALGSAGGGCADHIRFDAGAQKITCGTLTTGLVQITGVFVPVPAAAWLVAPAILAAGRFARRRKQAA